MLNLYSSRIGCSFCVSKWKLATIKNILSNEKLIIKAPSVGITRYSSYITHNYKPEKYGSQRHSNTFSKKILLSAVLSGGLAAFCLPSHSHAHWFSQQAETPTETPPVTKEEEEKEVAVEKPPLTHVWKDCKVTLYQYQNCPFCSKVRSFLQAYDIPFEKIEVHPFSKKEISFSEYKKLPLVTIQQGDGKIHQVNDSSVIISAMASYMIDNRRSLDDIISGFPTITEMKDGKEVKVIRNKNYLFIDENLLTKEKERALRKETKWRQWFDEYFIHLVSPNLYRTLGESYSAFDHHVSLGPYAGTMEGFFAKYFGSIGMWVIGKLVKRKYCISQDVREDLYKACNKVTSGIGKNNFLGGDEPNLADISLYGMMSVMDKQVVMDDLKKNTKIIPWYKRMKRSINKHNIQDLRHNLKYEEEKTTENASVAH